ncbi:TPA: restriction endonuclease subunit S [Streptococcus suis]|nr:restriction endonuclease subunit S [Streptococcus suis]
MKTNNNIPAYRFQGHTDSWELRKLGEVARFRRGSFPQPYGNSEWYDGDGAMPFVQVADVTDEMNLVGDTKQKISKKAQPLSVYAEKGSVLVTLQGSIGRVAITQYGAFIDRTVLIFENFYLPIDNLFWAYVIKQKFIEEAKSAPGGTIKTITKEVLSDFNIKLPTYSEQSAIGTFFSALDQQITHHQRKLDTLKEQKKTYLKLLFPAKGQTKPALRFQGFEDDWEEVKFGDLWNHTSEKNSELNYSSKDIISVAKMQQGKISKDSTDEYMKTYNILKYGDIAFEGNKSKEFSFGRFVYNDFKTGIVSHVFITFSPKVNMSSKFMKIFINNENIMKYELAKATTKTLMMTTLNVADMNKRRLRLPTLPEQEAIGTFFQTLDQEIAQVEDKLASLKEMKKTLLRKLFV